MPVTLEYNSFDTVNTQYLRYLQYTKDGKIPRAVIFEDLNKDINKLIYLSKSVVHMKDFNEDT